MSSTRHRRLAPLLAAALAALAACAAGSGGNAPEPATVADQLLAADRAFAAASERTDVAAGFASMLAAGVVMPVQGGFAVGKDSVLAAIHANPVNAGRLGWTPVRVGVSADGQQGFTLGYATIHGADGSSTPAKYLTYWVKNPEGWRAVVYKRGRASGSAPTATLPSLLPTKAVRATSDSALIRRYRRSLDSAERAFSNDAQQIGLEKAFARYGSADAMNMGGAARAAFVVGPDSIGAVVAEGEPATGSSVSWGPDQGVIVASSGDLGVTIGTIVVNEADSTGVRASFPFFTVWHRAGPDQPWRYVAE
ncbi:MAG: nuclear transport factor 2 family protein [Gemmatimonadales bacterium]